MKRKKKSAMSGPRLRELDASQLPVGVPLPAAIVSALGRVLHEEGRVLKPGDIATLRRWSARGIFGGVGWPESYFCRGESARQLDQAPASSRRSRVTKRTAGGRVKASSGSSEVKLVSVSVNSLRPGIRLGSALFSSRGVLLLAKGMEVTPHFLDKLRQHGMFEVLLDASAAGDLARSKSGAGRAPHKASGRSASPGRPRAVRADQSTSETRRVRDLGDRDPSASDDSGALVGPSLPLDDLRSETARAHESYSQSIDEVSELLADVDQGMASSVPAAKRLLRDFLDVSYLDGSILPAIVDLKNASGEYMFQHALNVSLLSMNAANHMGLSQEHVLEIGLGALLQDVGMLHVPKELRLAPRALTEGERQAIRQHPLLSLDALEKIGGVPGISKLIAYQSHERLDRSGYPRRRHRMFIHPYAQIVASIDAYAAICSERPHREAMSPYEGMAWLLQETHEGRFDREVIRDLLDCISLFPIGTFVRLSDGRTARVLRANPGQHTRPVVLPLQADGTDTSDELDLAQVNGIHIVEALRDLPVLTA